MKVETFCLQFSRLWFECFGIPDFDDNDDNNEDDNDDEYWRRIIE